MNVGASSVDAAIAALVKKGADIEFEGETVQSVFWFDTRLSNKDLSHLGVLTSLRELSLWDSAVDDAVWKHIRSLNKLASLDLSGTQVSSRGLQGLQSFPRLKSLELRQTSIGDAGLEYIGKVETLEELNLLGTRVTGLGLAHLAKLKKLRQLCVVDTATSDDGLRSVGKLASLQWLELEGTRITNGGMAHLRGLTRLQLLTVHNTEVNQAGLQHLLGMKDLKDLYIVIEDPRAALPALKQLPGLRNLYTGSGLSEEEARWLESQLSKVTVH